MPGLGLRTWSGELGGLYDRVMRYFTPPPIRTVEELTEFLLARSAYVAQKTSIDYCRGKTGTHARAMFKEKPFQEALNFCRWEGMAIVLSDLLVIIEGDLRRRPEFPDARVSPRLGALFAEVLARHPLPAHRPQGWGDAIAAFQARFAAACASRPRPAMEVAETAAARMFEVLPIHTNHRKFDFEIVRGAVVFHIVRTIDDFQARFHPELLPALAAAGHGMVGPAGFEPTTTPL